MNPGQERLFGLAAAHLAKLVMLQDRNPHSPTYGCFDRKFWHLRLTDFPSGMAQEFILPLALAYANPFPGNSFHAQPAVRDWVIAGIAYAQRSAHRDGSCDDYYPFEKASGATAFSLYAILESIAILRLDAAPFLAFIERRARWLGTHEESGRLSNHEALISNCLFRAARLTGKDHLRELAERRLERVLGWQNATEGWFYEYQGADPGYLMLTIANLAEILEMESRADLLAPIERAIGFLHALQPPDGWLGGEWTSRNTHNCFIHGLELCGRRIPQALQISDRLIDALKAPPEHGDDNIIAHHCWSYIKAGLLWKSDRPPRSATKPQMFPEAGIEIRQAGPFTLLTALRKGGSFRLYRGDELIHADTGISLLVKSGRRTRNIVCHLWSDDNLVHLAGDTLEVSGKMGFAKSAQMTPLKLMVLRLLMLSIGRFKPDLVRRVLQGLLITGSPKSPFRFERRLTLSEDGLRVEDTVRGSGDVVAAGVGPAQTSIYTVMSRVYHPSQLQPWTDLGRHTNKGSDPAFHCTRRIGGAS